jgi:hypothetical protein
MAPFLPANNTLDAGVTADIKAFCDFESPTFIVVIGAVIPILAYPILPTMPSDHGDGDTWRGILFYTSILRLVLIHGYNFLEMMSKQPHNLHLPFWVLPLTLCTLATSLCGLDSWQRPSRDLLREDFEFAAGISFVIFIYEVFWFGNMLFDSFRSTWIPNVVIHLIVVVGILTIALCTAKPFFDLVTTAFYQFTTRQVRWWKWLPKNGSKKDFTPGWSVFLCLFVIVSAPILTYDALKTHTAG